MDTVALSLTGSHLWQIDVPHMIGALLNANAVTFLIWIGSLEQAELDRRGILREQRGIHIFAVPGCPQWIDRSRVNL